MSQPKNTKTWPSASSTSLAPPAKKEEKDIDSLFTGGKTTALLNTISGLGDFELIAFLVVQSKTLR